MLRSRQVWRKPFLASSSRKPFLKNRARLELEGLENRTMPTVLFVPQLGAEGVPSGNGEALGLQSVHLDFWGPSSYWTPSLVSQFTSAATSLLSSDFLSGVTQYGSSGTAAWIDSHYDTSAVPPVVGNQNCEDEVENLWGTGGSDGDTYVVITPARGSRLIRVHSSVN